MIKHKDKLADISSDRIMIAPSLLAADFANLKSEIEKIKNGGADVLHLDVMDGHFVPNLTIGPPLVKSIRKVTDIYFDTHLMITNPIKYIKSFAEAGSDLISFHIECDDNISDVISLIREYNMEVGLTVKPQTPINKIFPYLKDIDMVLIMTVEPGFGGQSFMPEMMNKVSSLKEEVDGLPNNIHIQVDGGINIKTAQVALKSGANILVAGTSVFNAKNSIKKVITDLKNKEVTKS